MRILALLMFLFFLLPDVALAAFSFQIDSINPTSISSKEEVVQVTLSISDLPSESYFRVAWQVGEGEPYFGYVQNNSGEWVEIKSLSSDCREYFKVSDTGTTSVVLTTKIGEDSEISTGTYYLKAHRFTSTSCSASNIVPSTQIEVVLATPTPSPSPTPTPTPSAAPTNSPTPTPTPTQTKTPTPPPTSKPSPTGGSTTTPTPPKPTITTEIKKSDLTTPTSSIAALVLGDAITATPSQTVVTPAVETVTVERVTNQTDAVTAIAVGVTSLGLLGVIFYRLSKISIKDTVK